MPECSSSTSTGTRLVKEKIGELSAANLMTILYKPLMCESSLQVLHMGARGTSSVLGCLSSMSSSPLMLVERSCFPEIYQFIRLETVDAGTLIEGYHGIDVSHPVHVSSVNVEEPDELVYWQLAGCVCGHLSSSHHRVVQVV